jgi:hypothetical protein
MEIASSDLKNGVMVARDTRETVEKNESEWDNHRPYPNQRLDRQDVKQFRIGELHTSSTECL